MIKKYGVKSSEWSLNGVYTCCKTKPIVVVLFIVERRTLKLY